WIFALDRVGVARASAGLFVPTLVLMGVAATEGVTHAYGANPIQWPAALAGAGTLVLGAVVLYAFAPARGESANRSVWDRASIAIGGIGIALGVAVLFMPAFAAQISGEFAGQAFEASWMMLGAESAGGWLPLALSLLLVGAAFDASRTRWSLRRRLAVAAILALSCALWPLLASTPLRTWTRWIPTEVLQDLGTEYAHMTVEMVSQPLTIVALVVVLAGAACVALGTLDWAAVGRRAEGRA
ncbi:MAG: hypothetical protein HY876_10635, partial [Coriobacteriales bacterium]|nr:hypothetical protein [Coriobacteriales bacterium]